MILYLQLQICIAFFAKLHLIQCSLNKQHKGTSGTPPIGYRVQYLLGPRQPTYLQAIDNNKTTVFTCYVQS